MHAKLVTSYLITINVTHISMFRNYSFILNGTSQNVVGLRKGVYIHCHKLWRMKVIIISFVCMAHGTEVAQAKAMYQKEAL